MEVTKKEVNKFWRSTFKIHCKPMNAYISPQQCRENQKMAKQGLSKARQGVFSDSIFLDRLYHCGHCKECPVNWKPRAKDVYIPPNLPNGGPEPEGSLDSLEGVKNETVMVL